MTRHDALRLLEETLDLRPHSLTGQENLSDVEAWDSMSTIAFIAMVDKQFGVPLPGKQVIRCQTVDDLLVLMQGACSKWAA
jgi:acyl carrier protein